MKPAAELIVDSAGRHLVERERHHLAASPSLAMPLPQSQQHLQIHRMRKLRRAAEAAVMEIEAALQRRARPDRSTLAINSPAAAAAARRFD